jgi:hypothetical protein
MKLFIVLLVMFAFSLQGFARGGHRGTFFKEVTDASGKTSIVEYTVGKPFGTQSKEEFGDMSIAIAGACFIAFFALGAGRLAVCRETA